MSSSKAVVTNLGVGSPKGVMNQKSLDQPSLTAAPPNLGSFTLAREEASHSTAMSSLPVAAKEICLAMGLVLGCV